MTPPSCIECSQPADLVTGERIYPHRKDLHDRNYWLCGCGAYVGCHYGGKRPLGFPCGPKTRVARQQAHLWFDKLWQAKMRREGCTQFEARSAGYRWLAAQMDMHTDDCHIGMMTEAQAWKVVGICKGVRRAKR